MLTKKSEKNLKKGLTNGKSFDIIDKPASRGRPFGKALAL